MPKQVSTRPIAGFIFKKDTLIWEQYVPFTDKSSEQKSPKWQIVTVHGKTYFNAYPLDEQNR